MRHELHWHTHSFSHSFHYDSHEFHDAIRDAMREMRQELRDAFRGDAVNLRAGMPEPEQPSVHPAPVPSAAIIWSNPLPVIGPGR